ncbi:MAG: hypothetical protein NTX86_04170 [Candidatus Dependentiae bacterium]|nr:hypothetical protein [Candidatus Dependentiae bacterium]
MRLFLYELFFCCVVMGHSCFGAESPAAPASTGAPAPAASAVPAPVATLVVDQTPPAATGAPAVTAPEQPKIQDAPATPAAATPVVTTTIAPSANQTAPATTAAPTGLEAMPAAPVAATAQPAAAQATAPTEEEIQGIDTMNTDEPQGNWLFKRIWWQRAQTQYEKIKAVVDTIMESRMAFFDKRTEWDKTVFDPFYLEVGVGRGILEELIGNAVAQIDQERKKDGELSAEERTFLATLEAEKNTLEQLQKDIQKINQIDSAVDDTITMLIKQINVARGFEKQSWQNLKGIAQELSDEKARELYYGMVTYWQNINAVMEYIQNPLAKHFEQLGSVAQENIKKVTATLTALKEKGIDFKKQWQALEAKHQQERDAAKSDSEKKLTQEQIEKAVKEQQKKDEEAETKRAESGFFSRAANAVTNAASATWDYIASGAKTLWGATFGKWFGKSEVSVSVTAPAPVAPETAPVTPVTPAVALAPAASSAPVAPVVSVTPVP